MKMLKDFLVDIFYLYLFSRMVMLSMRAIDGGFSILESMSQSKIWVILFFMYSFYYWNLILKDSFFNNSTVETSFNSSKWKSFIILKLLLILYALDIFSLSCLLGGILKLNLLYIFSNVVIGLILGFICHKLRK